MGAHDWHGKLLQQLCRRCKKKASLLPVLLIFVLLAGNSLGRPQAQGEKSPLSSTHSSISAWTALSKHMLSLQGQGTPTIPPKPHKKLDYIRIEQSYWCGLLTRVITLLRTAVHEYIVMPQLVFCPSVTVATTLVDH